MVARKGPPRCFSYASISPFPVHSSKRNWRQPGKHANQLWSGLTLFEEACYGPALSVQRFTEGRESVLTHRQLRAHVVPLLLSLFLLCSTGMAWALPAIAADLVDGPPHGTTLSPLVGTEDAAPLTTAPQKARDLLKLLQERGGAPLPGHIGGHDFQNRERRLPRGRYREYDVNPKVRGRARDAERIVIEQRTGKAYYTGDHYQTFVPLN